MKNEFDLFLSYWFDILSRVDFLVLPVDNANEETETKTIVIRKYDYGSK